MLWRRKWQPTPVFLPGESPRAEEPCGVQFMGLQGIGHDRATKNFVYKLNEQSDNKQPCHTSFPILNQSVVPCLVLTVASCPAYRFLRDSKAVWSYHLFKNSPQFVVMHTVTCQRMLAIWLLAPLAFSKSTLYTWKISVHVLLNLAWRIGALPC